MLDGALTSGSAPTASAHRHRLSQDVHDFAGQAVAIILLELKKLSTFVHCANGRAQLVSINNHVEQMGSDLHRLAMDLRPASMERAGLADVVRAKAEDLCRLCAVAVKCEALGDLDDIPPDIAEALFHIFQEATTNIVRHARGATRVTIRLARRRASLVLIVADDGLASAMLAAVGSPARRSLGLTGMRERTAAFTGTTRFFRPRRGGWTVYAAVPLHRNPPIEDVPHGPCLLGG